MLNKQNPVLFYKAALGAQIRELRASAKLTQEELAAKAGLTRATIADIERGTANPSLDGLLRIMEALEKDPYDLFSFGASHQSRYIMQPFTGTLYKALAAQLTTVCGGRLDIQAAYAKSSGVDLLTAELNLFRRNGGQVHVMVGIDQKNTTAEALYKLLQLCDSLHVIHDGAFAQTYHPKIYMVAAQDHVWAAVGSNNLTRGGLCTNYEACHTQLLDLTNTFDRTAYQTLSSSLALYRESRLAMEITSPQHIQALLDSRLIVTEQQSRQNAGPGAASGARSLFGHRAVSSLPPISEKIAIPTGLFSPGSPAAGNGGAAAEPQPLRESQITAASLLSLEISPAVKESYWFEMRASTGGSRNILDLSSSAKLQGGTHPEEKAGQIPGSVTFFGLDPRAHDVEKNITVIYDGIPYFPSTVKFAPNNASWRIQLKGNAETGGGSLSQFGRSDFANHILVFHRLTPELYILETMAESELPALKAISEFWATNGSGKTSKAFGKIPGRR